MLCYTAKHHIPFEIDVEDYPIVMQHTWHCDSKGYVATNINGKIRKLHQLIMNTPKGMETDHINGDIKNNKKTNLRICTRAQNQHNQKPWVGGSSKYKGVCFYKKYGNWLVQIHINKKRIHIGYYPSEKEAALAYNKFVFELRGEYAYLNIVQED